MAGDSDSVSTDALEPVAYLGRSANRVTLLETLDKDAYTRQELHEHTGVARTTIDRIITEFEDRGWAERTEDGSYTVTRTGHLVASEFRPLLQSMETIAKLKDAADWIPVEELSIGLRQFSDATVRRGNANDPLELVEYFADLVRNAASFRTLTFLAPPTPVGREMQEGVLRGDLATEHILAGGLVDHLRTQQTTPPNWGEYIEAGAEVYRYEGHVPCNLFVFDDLVLLMNDRPVGRGAAIESHSEAVRAGATDLFETYKSNAVQVDADVFR